MMVEGEYLSIVCTLLCVLLLLAAFACTCLPVGCPLLVALHLCHFMMVELNLLDLESMNPQLE